MPDRNNPLETALRELKDTFQIPPERMAEARKILLKLYQGWKNK